MEITRSFDLLNQYKTKFANKPDALASKVDKKWVKYSGKEYVDNSNYVSYGLLSLKLEKGSKVAIISNSRPEWNFVDMGVAQAGLITVPVYPTISMEEYAYILKHADVKVLFVGNNTIFKNIKPAIEQEKLNIDIYTFEAIDGIKNFSEVIELGKKNEEKFKDEVEKIKSEIKASDLLTILYTSGTTGFPKGVMLTHENLMSNARSTTKIHPFAEEHTALSFLPMNHVYERMVNYHYQMKGINIYYAESMGTIVNDLKEVNPHIFSSVPRLLEKVYDGIIGKGKNLTGIKKTIFFWSVKLAERFDIGKKHRLLYNVKLKIARKLVFSKWIEALGGNVKIIVSGSAALQSRLAHIFGGAGIQVLEGYGLTETSPVVTVNWYHPVTNYRYGSVGKVLDGVEVKIADDGEILVKGVNVMMGYYNNQELTDQVMSKDGWFHTGDIGELSADNFLKITDRKKEIFKLTAGKYIAPQAIENKFKESFFIEQLMVVGANEKFVAAIISPNFTFLHDWCSKHKIQYRDNNDLIKNPDVIKRIKEEVNHYNQTLADFEKVKMIRLVKEEWSPQTGEMSPTLKLKRNILQKFYAELIDDIYAASRGTQDEKAIEAGANGFKISDVIKSANEVEIIKANFGDQEERRRLKDVKVKWKTDRRLKRTDKKNQRRLARTEWKIKRHTDKAEWKNKRMAEKEEFQLSMDEKIKAKPVTGLKLWNTERKIERTEWRLQRSTDRIAKNRDRKLDKIEFKQNRRLNKMKCRKDFRIERKNFRKTRKMEKLHWKAKVYKMNLK